MIRDTSAQDTTLTRPPRRNLRRGLFIGVVALVVLASGWSLGGRWLSGERSVDAARIRVAEVGQGLLVRDAAVNGRIVAAVSPTLYAPVASNVALKIAAGDSVERGQVLAELDSPELSSELQREQATLQSLEVEVARGRIEANRARLLARRTADEAELALSANDVGLESQAVGFELQTRERALDRQRVAIARALAGTPRMRTWRR